MMIRIIISAALVMAFFRGPLSAGLQINEFVTDSVHDWVEIVFRSDDRDSMDVSSLYVTMYYGTNEPLASEPVTLYSYDRPETAYDDRFLVVHLTEPGGQDETDGLGDVNGNGCRDVYCNNYTSSLWNSDGVVAIDTDDDPSNGGIIDFAAYSNRDGSMNSSIGSYIDDAANCGQWICETGEDLQGRCIDIGLQGLLPYQGVSRISTADTNSLQDFMVTKYQTPGRENITNISVKKRRLVRSLKKRIAVKFTADVEIPLFVYEQSNLRFRVFTVTGIMVYESPLFESVQPGYFSVHWRNSGRRRRAGAGMYIGLVESTESKRKIAGTETIYLVVVP
ncbi:MAG: hypothetical protein CVV44_01435 [Spirochaetae bacterium HGW-Spirochaetae-1]|nr:MAG: hypothetical protein CVV44_01435 [Spirochaetae bacterium HGW-Spirochaetae-1]